MIDMKKLISFVLSLFAVDVAFAACDLTERDLSKGSDGKYDEYLYADGSYSEMRQEGAKVKAYLCGYNACSVGDKLRLSNAAVGGNGTRADAVYECGKSSGGRDNYYWSINDIDSVCTVSGNKFKYDNKLKLWAYGNKYCNEINEVKQLQNILAVDNYTIINNITQDVNIEEVYNITIKKVKINKKLTAQDIKKIKELINKSENEIRKDLLDMGATIEGMQQDIKNIKGDVNALEREQFWDGIVNRIQNAKLNRLARKLRDVKSELKTKVNEEQVMDLINNTIKDMELTDVQVAQVKDMIADSARQTTMDIEKINAKLRSMNWRITKNEAQIAWVRFYNNLRNNSQDRKIKNLGDKLADMEKEQLTESDVERLIEEELKEANLSKNQLKTVRTEIDAATRGLNIKLSKLTKRVDELEREVDDIKTELTKQKVTVWFDRIKNNFINGVQDAKIKALGNKIDNLKKDIKERPTEDEVMDMIQSAIGEAELNDTQLAQVKNMINSEIESLGGDVQKLKRRVNSFEIKLAFFKGKLMWQDIRNNLQDLKIEKINKNIKKLKSEVDEKTTEEEVMDLIEDALEDAELSDAQTKQVEEMIRASAKKANARMDKIDDRISKLTQRIRKVEWDVFKLKVRLGALNTELDTKYALLKAKDKRLDKSIGKLKKDIKDIEEKLDDKVSKDQAHDMIQKAVDDAVVELGSELSAEIQNEFSEIVAQLNVFIGEFVGEIENRLAKVEADVAALQAENEKLLNKIAALQSLSTTQRNQIAALRQEVSKKTTVQEVIQLILDNTKNLTDGQKNEVVALIVEYTQYLSAGQKMEVEAMIRLYVDPKFQKIDRDMEKMRQQQVARDKINSAMSVLNSFAASAKVSVWKNAEGKFNTARLASDATAGVVLGTAGGLISNHLIKKNQINKGMEDIQCTVGGQVVAGYGDEFMVGMQ